MVDEIDRDRMTSAALRRICVRWLPGAGAALLAANLAGCGTISDETVARASFAPGRFDIYTCRELAERTAAARIRRIELEQLMARAEQGAGGAFVSAIAYRSDYAQIRGELVELSKAANDRQCAIGNPYSSGRAVF